MKLYLDDVRPAPLGFRLVRDYQTAAALLRHSQVDEISLDHDLGVRSVDGYKLLSGIEERTLTDPTYIPPYIKIHTANAGVREKMLLVATKLNKLRQERNKS